MALHSQRTKHILDGTMSKLLIFKPRCSHSGWDIDLMIETLHAGRERSAQAQREREKKESKNRLRVVDADSDPQAGSKIRLKPKVSS